MSLLARLTGMPEAPPAPPAEDRRSVIDGELVRTSVSAMQKADLCLSKYFFRYALGLPDDPPGKGQKRGTEGHGRIEKYLRHGVNVLDRLEQLGIDQGLIPQHGPGLLIEETFGKPTPLLADGVPLAGYIDLVNTRHLASTGVLWITDWKFKKSIEQYMCRPEQLIDPADEAGIQMIGYAEWARVASERFPGMRAVRLAHVTFQTHGQPSVVESAAPILPLTDIAEKWLTVTRRLIPAMRRAAAAKTHLEVPKNEKVCHKYHKACPYLGTCLDRMARLRAGFRVAVPVVGVQTGEVHMGMVSAMTGVPAAVPQPIQVDSAEPAKKRLVIKDVTAPAAVAANAQTGRDYTVHGEGKGASCRFLCLAPMGDQMYVSFIPLAGGPPVVVPGDTAVVELALVVPPDAPKSDPALASKPLPPVPDIQPDAAHAAAAAFAAAVPITPPVKEKKARAKKAEPAASMGNPETGEGATPNVLKDNSISSTPEPIHQDSAKPAAMGSMEGVHLYFGCSPIGVQTTHLGHYVRRIEMELIKLAQLNLSGEDIRTANDKVFGFKMWTGYLAQMARENLPGPGHYVVTGGDERVQVVADALVPLALAGCVIVGAGR